MTQQGYTDTDTDGWAWAGVRRRNTEGGYLAFHHSPSLPAARTTTDQRSPLAVRSPRPQPLRVPDTAPTAFALACAAPDRPRALRSLGQDAHPVDTVLAPVHPAKPRLYPQADITDEDSDAGAHRRLAVPPKRLKVVRTGRVWLPSDRTPLRQSATNAAIQRRHGHADAPEASLSRSFAERAQRTAGEL
jgi:hypothetical protein